MASAIIEAGSDAFGDMPSCIIVPIISIFFVSLSIIFWISVIVSELGANATSKSKNTFLPRIEIDLELEIKIV